MTHRHYDDISPLPDSPMGDLPQPRRSRKSQVIARKDQRRVPPPPMVPVRRASRDRKPGR